MRAQKDLEMEVKGKKKISVAKTRNMGVRIADFNKIGLMHTETIGLLDVLSVGEWESRAGARAGRRADSASHRVTELLPGLSAAKRHERLLRNLRDPLKERCSSGPGGRTTYSSMTRRGRDS